PCCLDDFEDAAVVVAHLRELYRTIRHWHAHRHSRAALWAGNRVVGAQRLGAMAPFRRTWNRNGSSHRYWNWVRWPVFSRGTKTVRTIGELSGRASTVHAPCALYPRSAFRKDGDPAHLRLALRWRGGSSKPGHTME